MTATDLSVWLVVAGVAVMVGVLAVFAYALIKAGDKPPQVALLVSLSLLSLTALAVGALIGSETAFTIASAGVGALAASVTAAFTEGNRQYRERQERLDGAPGAPGGGTVNGGPAHPEGDGEV